jgi:hypothetical protein
MTSERRRYQHDVEALLETIRHGVEELDGLRARGLRGRALAGHEAELAAVRSELAALVKGREPAAVPASTEAIPLDPPMRPPPSRRRPGPAWTPALR